MHNFVQKRCELTNCYFFELKSDKVLLFRIKNYDKSLLFTEKENKSLTDTDRGRVRTSEVRKQRDGQ